MWKITNISTDEEEIYYTQDELNSVCIQCKKELENCRLKKDYEELLKTANNGGALLVAESAKNKKYKQALEEIKKWVTNHNPCDIEAGINCTKEDCFECLNYDIKQITKIINEVLND